MPTAEQSLLMGKHFGACRFVYNLALETKKNAYITHRKNISIFDLMKQVTDLKKDCSWLKEVDSQSLKYSLIDLEKAFVEFFKGNSFFPKFKKKKNTGSFRNSKGNNIHIKNNRLYQNKFRDGIKVIIDRAYIGKIKNSTISKTASGKYYVSLLCETGIDTPIKRPITEKDSIGIDLGLSHFIVTSKGAKVDNPRHLRNSLKRLKVLQRRASKKKKGSANRRKANLRVALLHEKVSNQRKDFLHKLSTQLVKNHDTLCMEDLNVSNMVKNHNLALSISDAGWGEFVRQCKYKAEWYGKNFLQIPTFEPSTKICSACGSSNNDLTLKDREWTCRCGAIHDRDINAAINIKNYCLKNSGKGIPGEPVELPTMVGTLKREKSYLK